jgi:hypothetical protein
MVQLTVAVHGSPEDEHLLTLPFEVFGPSGDRLAQGTASPDNAATLDLPETGGEGSSRLFVRARLPNGEYIQQSAEVSGGAASVNLSQELPAPREWLRWVTPFQPLGHLDLISPAEWAAGFQRRIGYVWTVLWELDRGRWKATDITPVDQFHERGIRQLSLSIPKRPHLLQIGGDGVAWRLFSLPPGGEVRIALTRSPSNDSEKDSVDITIGRTRAANELIMAYLERGAVVEAEQLADVWRAADLALYEKDEDPVSATAGAYLLLKLKRLGPRHQWVDNLVNRFPYLSDGPVIAAALALQSDDSSVNTVRRYIDIAIERGLPVFSLGLSMLVETMAAVHRGKRESRAFRFAYLAMQAYLQASSSRGSFLSFYGKSPTEPSHIQFYGKAEAPEIAQTRLSHYTLPYSEQTLSLPSPAITGLPVLFERPLLDMWRSAGLSDVRRLGLAREVGITDLDALGLAARRSSGFLSKNAIVDGLLDVRADALNERSQNAFTVFDGDE